MQSSPKHAFAPRANAPFFLQPPESPALVPVEDYFSTASRKRSRPESRDTDYVQPSWWSASTTPSWLQDPATTDTLYHSGHARQLSPDLVNERYRLAGGCDTPSSLQTATPRLEHLTLPENEFRRRLRGDDVDFPVCSDGTPLPGPLARERNGVARIINAGPNELPQTSWTSLAFSLVGKVFNFGSSVVKGFYAGGGKGYCLPNSSLTASDLLNRPQLPERTLTPLPGEFLGDFEQDSPDFAHPISPPTRPAIKRRQTDRESWVMVGTPEPRPMSPKRKTSHNAVPRTSLFSTRPTTASRVSTRKSLAPVSRRQSTHHTVGTGSPSQTGLHSPAQSHSRRASTAQIRSPASLAGSLELLAPEAERYAKRQAKQERAADKTMSSMSNRIQEMMRQAQEALGTRYEVEGGDDMEDEGFVDDDGSDVGW